MRTIRVIIAGLALIGVASAPSIATPIAAQTPTIATRSSVPAIGPLSQRAGKIVMYRGSSVFGAGVGCPIRYKGQEIVELARGKFAEWQVPAGRYILNNHTSSIEVTVDAGETRYVRCMIKMGMLAGRADLQIVDEESFEEHRKEYTEKTLMSAPASINR